MKTMMLKEKLFTLCDETKTSREGILYLINYYINSLNWTEKEALQYAIGLFENGAIAQIKLFGADGKEI